MSDFDPQTGEVYPPRMQCYVEHSPLIDQIGLALATAQGKIEGAEKDSKNPHFNNRYASLASCYDACRAQMSENAIAIVQSPYNDGDMVGVETLLLHKSGQWLRGRVSARPGKGDAQGVGSVITYLRRYVLCSMVGVAPEDDDGNAAAEGTGGGRPQSSPPQGGGQTRPSGGPQNAAQSPSPEMAAKQERAKTDYNAIKRELAACQTVAEHETVMVRDTAKMEAIKEVSPQGYANLMTFAQECLNKLRQDTPDDDIPI